MTALRSVQDRRGFSMVEMMIVAVLGSIIVASAYQILTVNQRTYTAQTAQIQGQQTVRAASDVLFAEFRELSTQGGDIVAMSADSLRVKVMRTFGVVCTTATNQTVLTVMKAGQWFKQYDTVYVMADNKVELASDDKWRTGIITSAIDTMQTCGSKQAQSFTVPAISILSITDTVKTGAPIRSFVTYTYGIFTVGGVKYLARRDTDGTLTPLVGPLSASSTSAGLAFEYMKANGTTTTQKDSVAQIRVTLRTLSNVRDARGNLVADSVKMRIFTRN